MSSSEAKPQVPIVPSSDIPWGWTNNPAYLRAHSYFADEPGSIKENLRDDYQIPNAQPILSNGAELYLLDGGDRKYYLWDDLSDFVARIDASDLKTILETMGEHGIGRLKYTMLALS